MIVVGMSIGSIVIPFVLAHGFSILGMHTFFQLITIVFSGAGFTFVAMILVSFWHNSRQKKIIRNQKPTVAMSINMPAATISLPPTEGEGQKEETPLDSPSDQPMHKEEIKSTL